MSLVQIFSEYYWFEKKTLRSSSYLFVYFLQTFAQTCESIKCLLRRRYVKSWRVKACLRLRNYKIIWIVLAFWLVYKRVFIALWSTKMTWAICLAASNVLRVNSFGNEIEVYICTSYIVFLFVTTKNNFINEIKHVIRAFIARWAPPESCWEFSSRWNPRRSRGFSLICSRILPNARLVFNQVMKTRKTYFIS